MFRAKQDAACGIYTIAAMTSIAISAMSAPASATAHRSLMSGAHATQIGEARILPKWAKVMSAQATLAAGSQHCPIGEPAACQTREWRTFSARVRRLKGAARLDAVNEFVNRVAYRTDDTTYRIPDYWASPSEFFKNGGDCEDFVIAKYFILKHFGVPTEDMRMAVVVDSGLGHAILVVKAEGQDVPLDNRFSIIESIETRHRYKVVYSFDEQHAWVHTKTVYKAPSKPIKRTLFTWFRSPNVFEDGLPQPAAAKPASKTNAKPNNRKSVASVATNPGMAAPTIEALTTARVGATSGRPKTKAAPSLQAATPVVPKIVPAAEKHSQVPPTVTLPAPKFSTWKSQI